MSRVRALRGPALALLLAAALAAPAVRAVEVPYLTGRVVDDAELLDGAARARIEALLAGYEQRTTAQIVVVTLRTLDGEPIEAFASRAFQAWKLGQKGKDNGALLVVVPDDRKMRIEVGYGLEGALTDVAASRIIRNVLAPAFREQDYAGGIERGVQAMIGQLDGQEGSIPDDPAPAEARGVGGFQGPDLSWPERLLFGAFIFGVLGVFEVVGVATPGVGWFLYLFLIPFWAIFPMVPLGSRGAVATLATHLVGFPVAKLLVKRTAWYRRGGWGSGSGGGRTGRSGWISSSSSSSSWSSRSSSGSSFSGGGGSSGGGGASGGW